MSLNQLDALGSILGGIASIISLLGILFAVSEIRRARLVNDRETDFRIYEMMLEIDRFFVEHPDLRPFIYEDKPVPEEWIANNSLEYSRLLAATEMLIDFMECAYSQFDLMPLHQRVGWISYMQDLGQNSPIVRQFLQDEADWGYLPGFVALILEGDYRPNIDRREAVREWRARQHANKADPDSRWRNLLTRLGREPG